MKTCSKCNTTKSKGEFYTGNNPYCKSCTSEYNKQRVRIGENINKLTIRQITQMYADEDLELTLREFIKQYS